LRPDMRGPHIQPRQRGHGRPIDHRAIDQHDIAQRLGGASST
jgi:hypothetical protein